MKILTAQQMRELDRETVERCGVPYATLMETAGSRVVEAIVGHYGSVKDSWCIVYCGKGNNGGDGAVIARLLHMLGAGVGVFLLGSVAETTGAARANFEILQHYDAHLLFDEIGSEKQPVCDYSIGADIVVDALLGTGITRPAEGLYAEAIDEINSLKQARGSKTLVVSVDIPSGLSSDAAVPFGPYVQADLTVAFSAPKIANILPPACEANGKLIVSSIGTPNYVLWESESTLHLVTAEDVTESLKESKRDSDAHKTTVGDVLLIAGSRGKTGAAALASESVLRAGAGLVTVATAKSAQTLLVTQTKPEVMTEALAETFDGAISQEAVEHVLRLAEKKTVIAVGPGLSSADESARAFVRELVERRTVPMVIDADGLNALAPWPSELKGSDELPIIITPHPGEMARLIWKTNADVQADRIGMAREFATQHHVIVVLKGSRSLIAAPDGNVYVNPTGNAGMATAGSGDVLTGLIASLLAQVSKEKIKAALADVNVPEHRDRWLIEGYAKELLKAVIAGVYLHGLAGDIAAGKLGMRSMIASDIIANLSEAILQVGGEAEKGTPSAITRL